MTLTNTLQRTRPFAALTAVLALVGLGAPDATVAQETRTCTEAMVEPVSLIRTGPTRDAALTKDGCWVFAAYVRRGGTPGQAGVAVLKRGGGTFQELRTFPVPGGPPVLNLPFALALTNDEKLLVASHANQVTVFDVDKLKSGEGDPAVGKVTGDRIGGSFGIAITPDDRYAFVAQGRYGSVVLIDLQKGRASGFEASIVAGLIPTAEMAIIPVLSPDAKYLYTTTHKPPDVVTPSMNCMNGKEAEGAVQIVDVARARIDPRSATISFATPAGCKPGGLALSPDGTRLSVTGSGDTQSSTAPEKDSAVVIFDVKPVRDGKDPILAGRVPVGRGPTSIVDTGNRLLVGHVSEGTRQITVIDPAKAASGAAAIVGVISIPVTSLRLSTDRNLLFGADLGQNGLFAIDLNRVQPEPLPAPSSILSIASDPSTPASNVTARDVRDCTGPMSAAAVRIGPTALMHSAIVTGDNCWFFNAFTDIVNPSIPGGAGISVRRRNGDNLERVRFAAVPLQRGPENVALMGMTMTSDEKVLVVSNGRQLTFLDVDKFIAGGDPILGRIEGGLLAGSADVVVTADGHYAFAAQRDGNRIVIIDIAKGRASGFNENLVVGAIPTAAGPTTLVASPDKKYLYAVTTGTAEANPTAPCRNGVVQTISLERAINNPSSAVVATVEAGCSPRSAAISPDGKRLSVALSVAVPTPGSGNAVVVFDATPDGGLKQAGRVPLPAEPAQIADSGKYLSVTLRSGLRTLLIDPAKAAMGERAILGRLPTGGVTLSLSSDRRTLHLSNFGNMSVIDLERAQVTPLQK